MNQPDPVRNEYPKVWDMVIEEYRKRPEHIFQENVVSEMRKRDILGLSRYGTHLQPFNGRDALEDLKDEVLDSVCYISQAIYEGRDVDGILAINRQKLFDIAEEVIMIIGDLEEVK